ncbi:MAG: DUF1631 family protein [Methylosarcina sp.]
MNNFQPLPPVPIKTNTPGFIEPFKSVFFHYFEQLVDNCCMRIEPEFSINLGRDRETTSKEYNKNLLEYLRSVRFEIKTHYLLTLNESFDLAFTKKEKQLAQKTHLTPTSLANDDYVKEDYASTLIIRECEKKHHEQITRLNHLIAILSEKSAAADRQNPVAPENLVRTLFAVIKPLKLNGHQRVALYKTFEANVFNQMGFIYQELIKHCESSIKLRIEKGELEDNTKPKTTPPETMNQEFRQLQLKLAEWRTYHALSGFEPLNIEGNHFYEHFEIKNALQVLGQFSLTTNGQAATEKKPIKWQVINTLKELNFSDEAKSLAKTDEDILDLVSLIFTEIAASAFLLDSIKSSIARLEIPMSAACLGQYSVFTNPNHPIRRLLDQLIETCLFLNFEHETDRLIQRRISEIMDKLVSDFGFDPYSWTSAGREFARFIENYQKNSKIREESAIKAMIEHETLFSAQKEVAEIIIASSQNKVLPPTVTDFLQNVWRRVMLQAYLVRDRQPETWEETVKAMDQLIISVTPPVDDEERKHILKLIPGIIKCLRSGLALISYEKETLSRFFKELAVLHIIAMDKKEAKTTEAGASKEKPEFIEKIEADTEEKPDRFSPQVNQLKVGDWLVFNRDIERKWGKLARIGSNKENLLFVGKNGEKIVQIEAGDLAEELRLGRAAPLKFDNRSITDLVLLGLSTLNTTLYH